MGSSQYFLAVEKLYYFEVIGCNILHGDFVINLIDLRLIKEINWACINFF